MALIYSSIIITLYLILPTLSAIESASGEDSSGIEPASREDESGEDEPRLESGSGAGMFWLFFTYLIWLFSEFMAVSLSRSGFCSNPDTQIGLEQSNI